MGWKLAEHSLPCDVGERPVLPAGIRPQEVKCSVWTDAQSGSRGALAHPVVQLLDFAAEGAQIVVCWERQSDPASGLPVKRGGDERRVLGSRFAGGKLACGQVADRYPKRRLGILDRRRDRGRQFLDRDGS